MMNTTLVGSVQLRKAYTSVISAAGSRATRGASRWLAPHATGVVVTRLSRARKIASNRSSQCLRKSLMCPSLRASALARANGSANRARLRDTVRCQFLGVSARRELFPAQSARSGGRKFHQSGSAEFAFTRMYARAAWAGLPRPAVVAGARFVGNLPRRGWAAVVPGMEASRLRSAEVEEPERPHEQDRPQNALALPLPRRGAHLLAQAPHLAQALQPAAQLDVLHQRDIGKPSERLEGAAPYEDRLIAGRDARQAGAPVHECGDHPERPAVTRKAHVE